MYPELHEENWQTTLVPYIFRSSHSVIEVDNNEVWVAQVNAGIPNAKKYAKLIVAAPELLKALIDLSGEVQKQCPIGSDPKLLPMFKKFQEAQAAIKKATE